MFEKPKDQGHTLEFNQHTEGDRDIWDFYCPSCGFKGKYVIDVSNGYRQMEIANHGDPEALHYSDTLLSLMLEDFVWKRPDQEDIFDWDHWLNPDIRQKLNQIAAHLDD